MAMMSELDAHGPVARALLGITVVKDVAVVLLFALVLVLGRALTSAGALNVAVAGTAILQLLGSAAVGTLLGYALGQYLGLVRRAQDDFFWGASSFAWAGAPTHDFYHIC